MSAMSYEELAGEYRFESVVPEPLDGPFPPQATTEMGITLSQDGSMTVQSPINSGDGSFVLSGEGTTTTTITFSGESWTECALDGVDGDDANGTLERRMNEAEDLLQQRLSGSAGAYRLTITRRGGSQGKRELVLESQNDGTKLTFVEA
jgi:hypothetical protein